LGAWAGFAGAWLGMQPRLFQSERRRPLAGAAALLRRGCWNAALGACILALARATSGSTESAWPETALVLVGSSLLLHFGVCHLLAGAWRLAGVPCEPLFRDPLRSESLSEFWGRRWNLAFSELTASVVYRPVASRFGKGAALGVSFLWSGLLHEMALSVPVRAGFGLPTLYFVLHGALVSLERGLARAGWPLGGPGGRVWTLFWLVAPLPLLAHAAFVSGIVTPLLAAGSVR
jgi:alginate O-acetyltransferase complex protein AlgI